MFTKFEKPTAEIIKFDVEDICTASSTEPGLPDPSGPGLPWD